MLTLNTLLIICPLVFLAGFVDAIAGGGGLISLPAYLLAGLPPHAAIATNKMSSTIGTCASTARYLKNGFVDWQAAVPCMVMAILGANLGARLILLIPQQYIQYLLLGTLPVIAFVVLKRKPVRPGEQPDVIPRGRQLVLAGALSLVIGLYDGLYGPGTGTFLLMVYTGLCKMSLERASGTVKLVNLSSNVTSLVLFLVKGQVLVLLGVISGGFCLLGHFIGSGMMMKNGSKIVRPVIIVVLVLLFIKVISDKGIQYEQDRMERLHPAGAGTGGTGKLRHRGTSQRPDHRLDGHHLQRPAHDLRFHPPGTLFLRHHQGNGGVCHQPDHRRHGPCHRFLRGTLRPGYG